MKQGSRFTVYSLGIVATDKPTSSYVIQVMPIEHITEHNEDINATEEYKSNTVDHKNRSQSSITTATSVIEATWIPLGTPNRISAPDVIKGETVLIYTYADTNEYYWTTIFNEPEIRRSEKVLYAYSNMSTGAREQAFDRTTSYWMEIDTLNKYVKVHTSENDGEATTYDVTIDTLNGKLTITDGLGNSMIHDSNEGTLAATYSKKITLTAPEVVISASNSVTINTDDLNINANTIDSSAGNLNTAGDVSIGGVCISDDFIER